MEPEVGWLLLEQFSVHSWFRLFEKTSAAAAAAGASRLCLALSSFSDRAVELSQLHRNVQSAT
jgi:hypothetical protein